MARRPKNAAEKANELRGQLGYLSPIIEAPGWADQAPPLGDSITIVMAAVQKLDPLLTKVERDAMTVVLIAAFNVSGAAALTDIAKANG